MLDWVIVGGESGPNARPMHPDWPRRVRDQCAAAGVPYFFKQWGAWAVADRGERGVIWLDEHGVAGPGNTYDPPVTGGRQMALLRCVGKRAAGRLLDGVEHNATPEARA